MIMAAGDIVREYIQAKQPLKQIGILAEENLCDKKEIVAILLAAGCNLPHQYDQARHKTKKQPETAPDDACADRRGPHDGRPGGNRVQGEDHVYL